MDTTVNNGGTTSVNSGYTNPCLDERDRLVFFGSSFITFVGGLLIICFVKGIQALTKTNLLQIKFFLSAKRKCQYLVSGQTFIGKLLLSGSCLLSIASLIIYLVEASEVYEDVEDCGISWQGKVVYFVDFAFNIFFLILFIIKFLAADNKVMYWLSLYSLVDMATIPPSFVTAIKQRQWLGLRFMRAFRIMYIPDVLQYLGILKRVPVIRFAQLISVLLSTMLAAAGAVQLLELSGDWFVGFANANPMPYWESLYFIIVTMSTVGYGDVTCRTASGRLFICIFILSTLAFIATCIPELAELVSNREPKLRVSLQVESDMTHIVVCGNLTYRALENFLSDFLHPDRRHTRMTKVVIMNKKPLSLDIKALLKEYFTRIMHITESPLQRESLKRVKIHEADACVIMANQTSKTPDVDDMRNIMKAISIKNYSNTRIIIQLLKPESQIYLENLPRWQKFEDNIVCISQVKQSIMAAGCMTPGFSTLLANLVFTLDIKTTSKDSLWFDHYCQGASMELYRTTFSQSFFGMTFEDAARICYSKLDLMLIGVGNCNKSQVFANPSKQDFLIGATSSGLFICQKEQDLQRVRDYCSKCHRLACGVKLIKKCSCPFPDFDIHLPRESKRSPNEVLLQEIKPDRDVKVGQEKHGNKTASVFGLTKKKSFNEHIVVCPGTPMKLSEVESFIIQLKKVQLSKIHDIVSFLDESDPSAFEWKHFCQQQGVFLIKGSPLISQDLKDIDIEKCKVCIVLSGSLKTEDSDEEANMDSDVHSVLTTLFVRNTIKDLLSVSISQKGMRPQAMTLTEIAYDSNAHLIGDPDETKALQLSKSFASGKVFSTSVLDALMSMIYCNPGAFSFMKSLGNMDNDEYAYKNETMLLTIDDLIPNAETVGETSIAHSRPRFSFEEHQFSRRMETFLLSINHLNLFQPTKTFGDVFLNSLDTQGILCLGLYRRFGQYSNILTEEDRFVITNPQKSLLTHPTDLIYCLVPSSKSPRESGK